MTTTKPTDPRVALAARNNADLYEAMFTSHGLTYRRTDYAFIGLDKPPPYYSNLTVLSDNHATEILLRLRELSDQFDGKIVFKDSFSQFDLSAHGVKTLFSATWIWRKPAIVALPDGWHRVQTPQELAMWERAWSASGSPTDKRLFRDALLDRPDVVFFGKKRSQEYVAGGIANLSDDCIGISNVYTRTPSPDVFADASAAAASLNARLPLVGYESGDDLMQARNCGFDATGDLRVMIARSARL